MNGPLLVESPGGEFRSIYHIKYVLLSPVPRTISAALQKKAPKGLKTLSRAQNRTPRPLSEPPRPRAPVPRAGCAPAAPTRPSPTSLGCAAGRRPYP
jgi:hypothetical protein